MVLFNVTGGEIEILNKKVLQKVSTSLLLEHGYIYIWAFLSTLHVGTSRVVFEKVPAVGFIKTEFKYIWAFSQKTPGGSASLSELLIPGVLQQSSMETCQSLQGPMTTTSMFFGDDILLFHLGLLTIFPVITSTSWQGESQLGVCCPKMHS